MYVYIYIYIYIYTYIDMCMCVVCDAVCAVLLDTGPIGAAESTGGGEVHVGARGYRHGTDTCRSVMCQACRS